MSSLISADSVTGSLTGSTAGSTGVPGAGSTAGTGGGSAVSSVASGPPQYDISFLFQDNNKLAKNAKRSYELQVRDAWISVGGHYVTSVV